MATEPEDIAAPPAIYIMSADNGNIRKWSREPFAGGVRHLYVREPDLELVTKLRDALADVVDGISPHDFPSHFGIPEARAEEIRALAGLSAKG